MHHIHSYLRKLSSINRYWYTKNVPVSTDMVHGNVPISTDTGTQKTFQYRPILVHEIYTSTDRYWNTKTVPVSTSRNQYQYTDRYWNTFDVLVLTNTGTYQHRSIDRYWYIFTFQYLGPKVHLFPSCFWYAGKQVCFLLLLFQTGHSCS